MNSSIFSKYYQIPNNLTDKFLNTNFDETIDVIIPLINTNELFERNLYSFYKEIPIRNLIIGDGGSTDGSLEILKQFPRVKVLDHKNLKSQGGSIIDLITNVKSDYFIYLHADAFLPNEWYEKMKTKSTIYDWFECNQKLTTLIEFWAEKMERSFSGAQMGNRKIFDKIIPLIKDDYLQRNEDIIIAELIEHVGGKYGKNEDAFNYHQVMNRRGESEPKFKKITLVKDNDYLWEKRIFEMQYKGIVKYLNPNKAYLISEVNDSIAVLEDIKQINKNDVIEWIKKTNPSWLPFIKFRTKRQIYFRKIVDFIKRFL